MIPGYTTNVKAFLPLLDECNSVLLTAREVADHLRYSTEQLSNLRRSRKGPPFIRLPNGGVRYRSSELLSWQMSGNCGALTMERVAMAVAACKSVPLEQRSAMLAHLEAAFSPAGRKAGEREGDEPQPTAPTQPAITLALLEQAERETMQRIEAAKAELLNSPALARIEEAKAEAAARIGAAKAELRQAEAQQMPAIRRRGT